MALRNAFENVAVESKQNILTPYNLYNSEDNGVITYICKENTNGNWFIAKYEDGAMTYASGLADVNTAWSNRATQTYDTFANTFGGA